MNTEELEQIVKEGQNRNTASQTVVLTGCQKDSAESFFPVRKTNEISVSSVSLPTKMPSHAAHLLWTERTAGSLSLDKK